MGHVTSVTSDASSRAIWRLAIPAFFTLVAEPLFLLVDSAIVGHLGTDQLAALGIASSVLLTASGIFVFLAYATTSLVARRLGAGHHQRALSAGVDGLWLAFLLALPTAAALAALARPLVHALGGQGHVVDYGATYLRISAAGLPGLLLVLAATGALRGLQDTRTPLRVATVGFSLNIVLNCLLVYAVGLGIAGSAWGTVIAQTAMGGSLAAHVLRGARRANARTSFHPGAVLAAARLGVPLLVRTMALRAAMLLTTWCAAALGAAPVAAHQVALTIFGFMSFALDALAIAAQALIGMQLGAGNTAAVRATTRRLTRWGLMAGTVLGAGMIAVAWVLPGLFSGSAQVRSLITAALIVVGLIQPVAGVVYLLDGILMGAGDGRALAWLQVGALACFAPLALWLHHAATRGDLTDPMLGLRLLWVAFGAFMLARLVGLVGRARTDAWMVTGA